MKTFHQRLNENIMFEYRGQDQYTLWIHMKLGKNIDDLKNHSDFILLPYVTIPAIK